MRRFRGLLALAFVFAAVPALAADPTGTWKWTVERGGRTMETTIKLKKDGDKLTGTVSGRNNTETPIEDGKVEGDEISFKVVREFGDNRMVQTYKGKVGDDAIKGTVEFEREGETLSRDWEAKKQ